MRQRARDGAAREHAALLLVEVRRQLDENEKEEAREVDEKVQKAVALEPEMGEAYYQLGLLLNKRGEHERSELAFARFKALRDAESSDRGAILKELQDSVQ